MNGISETYQQRFKESFCNTAQMPFQVHPKVYVGALGFRQGVHRFFLSWWAQLPSFEREEEEGEQRKKKLDLNLHVFTAVSCGRCGSWSTCSFQAGSATGVH